MYVCHACGERIETLRANCPACGCLFANYARAQRNRAMKDRKESWARKRNLVLLISVVVVAAMVGLRMFHFL